MVLDARTAAKSGYGIGERVHLVTTSSKAVLDPRLVGVADFQHGGSLNGATLSVFDTRTAQDLFLGGKDAYTDVWVTAKGGVSQAELRDRVAKVLPPRVEAVTGDKAADEAASELLKAVSFLTTFLLIFAGIALVVGAFLIVNTFSILVAQRSRELALLRALGASKRQVTWSVQLEAFVLGVLGSTVGLGLGVLLAMAIRSLFARFGLDLSGQPLIFAPRTFVAAYAVGVLVTMAAAWLPARRTTRIAPVQALRDDIAMPESSLHRRLLLGVVMVAVGLGVLYLGLFTDVPHGGYLLGAGVLAILLGVSAASPVISKPFLAVDPGGLRPAVRDRRQPGRPERPAQPSTHHRDRVGAHDRPHARLHDGHRRRLGQGQRRQVGVGELHRRLRGQQRVRPGRSRRPSRGGWRRSTACSRWSGSATPFGERNGDRQGLAATDPAGIGGLNLTMDQGTTSALKDGTVLVSKKWGRDEHVGVGDTVTFEMPTGKKTYPVVGTFEDNPMVFMPVLTTIRTLRQAGFPNADNGLILTTADRLGIQRDLEQVVADQPIVTVKNEAEFAAEQRGPIDQLVLMIYALLGLALVIAVLGIVNTLALSVIERTREVGLLRAIGVSRAQLRRMITLESVVISVLGAVLGVVLGIGFGVALMYSLRDQGLEVISVPRPRAGPLPGALAAHRGARGRLPCPPRGASRRAPGDRHRMRLTWSFRVRSGSHMGRIGDGRRHPVLQFLRERVAGVGGPRAQARPGA